MASDTDICTLALGHIGHERLITSIAPPDGSVEAQRCARYYPIARNAILEAHEWGFATKRVGLADLGTPVAPWAYRYAWPTEALVIQALLVDESNIPQEYATESDASGRVIYCDIEDAQVKYTKLITDINQFPAMAQTALSFLLASFLAGPTIKGKAGVAVSDAMVLKSQFWLGKAKLNDANNQKEQVKAEPTYQSLRVRPPGVRARS